MGGRLLGEAKGGRRTVGKTQGAGRSGEERASRPSGTGPAAGEPWAWRRGGWGGRGPGLTQARVGVPGRGGPPRPVSVGRAAALAPRAGGVVAAAAAGGPGPGSAAGCVAVALAAASHCSCCQPCPARELHAEVTGHHGGPGGWWGSEGHPLGPPQGPGPRGSAPQ